MRSGPHALLTLIVASWLWACSDTPAVGAVGGACYPNQTCDRGLVCSREGRCVTAAGSADAGGARDAGPSDTEAAADAAPDAGSGTDAEATDAAASDAGPTDAAPPDGGALANAPEGCFRAGPTVLGLERRSIVASPSGHLHVAVGGDALYHAERLPGGQPILTLVDPRGGPASITLDDTGEPVIAYFDRYRRSTALAPEIEGLKLARRVGGRWVTQSLLAEWPRPRRSEDDDPAPAVVVDARGLVHLALKRWSAREPTTVELMTWDGARLARTTYDRLVSRNTARAVELVRDAAGEPVLFVDTYDVLWMVRHGPSGWGEPEPVSGAQGGGAIEWRALADAAGRPGVALLSPDTGGRWELWRRGGMGWDRVGCPRGTAAAAARPEQPGVLADGTPIFAALLGRPGSGLGMISAVRVGESCVEEPIVADTQAIMTDADDELVRAEARGFAVGGRVRGLLRLDPDAPALELHVSDDDGATYRAHRLLEPRLYGLSPSLVVLPDGRPVIASVEQLQGVLEVSTYDPAQGAFVTEGVPLARDEQGCRSIQAGLGAVDALAHPSGDLLVAHRRCSSISPASLSRRSPSGWTHQPIPTTDRALTLALQPDTRPAVATRDTLLSFDGAAWVSSLVPPNFGASTVASRAGLAYDPLGRAVFGHLRGADVHVARRDPQVGWVSEAIDTHSRYLRTAPAALRVTSDGRWVYAYGRYAEGTAAGRPGPTELRVATRDAAGWTVETVARLGWQGEYVPLEGLDLELLDDRPVVVFRSSQESALVLAWRDAGGAWQRRVLSADGDTGLYPSLALFGRTAHVAFHHGGTGDLCYLRAELP